MYINPNNLVDLAYEIHERRQFSNSGNPIKNLLLKIFGDGIFGLKKPEFSDIVEKESKNNKLIRDYQERTGAGQLRDISTGNWSNYNSVCRPSGGHSVCYMPDYISPHPQSCATVMTTGQNNVAIGHQGLVSTNTTTISPIENQSHNE